MNAFLTRKRFICLLVLSFMFGVSGKVDASVLFEDNFDSYPENSFPGKWINYNSPGEILCAAQWKTFAGMLNIKINQNCNAHIIPSPSEYSPLNEYVIEADVRFNGGVDRHIAYWLNTSTNGMRVLHFTAPGDFSVDSDNPFPTLHVGKSYQYNNTYRFKVIVTSSNVKVYSGEPNGSLDLVHDVNQIIPLSQGIFGLGSSPGSSTLTETWFDNVRITTLDHVDPQPEPGLPVPLLKQTNPLWGSDIYDSASSWSSDGLTMSRWGCAVASASMIFQYNGLEKMEDNSDLTPGSVNQWLKNQVDGYVRGGLLNWLSLSRLSKQIADNNGVTFDALEYESRNPDNAFLANILDNSLPAILSVPGHFIVAKGVDAPNSTFWINDPFDTIVKLSDPPYSNTYSRMGTYTQSNTDLSYIMLVVNPQVEIELLDEAGDPIPTEVSIEGPIDDAEGESINSVGPLKILYAKKPEGGEYQLYLSSATGGSYVVDQYFYDQNGEVKKITASGNLPAGATDEYKLFLDKENSSLSTSEKVNVVTFDSIKTKINEGYKAKKIKDKITYLALVAELEIARKTRFISLKKALLDLMIITISRSRSIDKTFGQDLIADLKVLKASI